MFDGALSWLALVAADALRGRPRRARGELQLAGALNCYRPYRCADGYVTLGALEPKFWRRWCAASAARTWSGTRSTRRARRRTWRSCEIFAARTREQWRQFASEHDCCLEPVLELDEALESELVAAREMVVELDAAGRRAARCSCSGSPVKLEPHARRPGARAGPGARRAHREVLAEAGLHARGDRGAARRRGAAAGTRRALGA